MIQSVSIKGNNFIVTILDRLSKKTSYYYVSRSTELTDPDNELVNFCIPVYILDAVDNFLKS